MEKIKLLLMFLLLFSKTAIFSQEKTTVISDFVKAIFVENKSTQLIADQYIYFEPIADTTVSITDRIKFLDMLLSNSWKEKTKKIDPSNFEVVKYADFKGDKVKFLHETTDSYIVVSNNIPFMYVYLKENKIFSFNYVLKGGEALFISY